MTLKGYARVSRADQSLDLQVDALLKAGCMRHHIYSDKTSGVNTSKPGLDECLDSLQPGDTLVVYRLDRIGRTTSTLLMLINELKERGIGFRSLQEGIIDTTSATGQLVLTIIATLANFERNLLIERTKAGLEAAKKRGRVGGRPKVTDNHHKVTAVKNMYGKMTIREICKSLHISRTTVYKYLKQ